MSASLNFGTSLTYLLTEPATEIRRQDLRWNDGHLAVHTAVFGTMAMRLMSTMAGLSPSGARALGAEVQQQYKEESEKVRPLSFISCKCPWLTISCRKISTKTATSSISPTARAPPAHPTHPPTLISRNRSRNCPSTLRKSDAFIPHRSLLSGHSS